MMLLLISLRIATTLLSVEQFGIFALLTGFRAFFGLLFINPVGQHINRHTHEWFDDGSLRERLHRYNGYIFLVALLAIMLVAVWALLRATLTVEAGWLAAVAMGVSVYAGTWNGTLIPMLNMVGFRGLSVSLEILTALLVLVGSVLLVLGNDSGVYWFTGSVFGLAFVAVLAWRSIQRKMGNSADTSTTFKLLDRATIIYYCLPLAAATGFMWLLTSGYRFVIEWGWGSTALGFMAVGFGVASQMWSVCETLLMQFLFPHFYKAISDGNQAKQQQAYTDLINTLTPLYLILLGITLATGGWVMALLTDIKFHGAYLYVLFGAIIEWCRVMSGLLSQAAQVTKRPSYNIVPYACAGSFAIATCVVGGMVHAQLIVVASVLAVAGVLLLVSMGWQMNRLIPIVIDWRNMVSPGLFVIVVVTAATAVGIEPKPVIESTIALAIVGLISIAAVVVYLKRCSAYQALLSVRLR